MPTYRNDTAAAITGVQGKTVAPGGSCRYSRYLTDAHGLTLTAHKAAPWVKLYAGAAPASITEVQGYTQIRILNESGAAVSVEANDDASNPIRVQNNGTFTFAQDHEVQKLIITGGTGNVYVYGMRP